MTSPVPLCYNASLEAGGRTRCSADFAAPNANFKP